MLEATTIARPYARAAFAQAREEGQLAAWSRNLGRLGQLMANAQLRSLVGDPRLGRARLTRLLLELLPEQPSRALERFVRLLVQAGRLSVLPALCVLFESQRAEAEQLVRVRVQTAFPLDAEQRASLTEALARRFDARVELEEHHDRELIGGVVLRRGDTVMDASLRGRLQRLGRVCAGQAIFS